MGSSGPHCALTEVEPELSGQLDSQQKPSGGQQAAGMSLPVPVNINKSLVKEWLAKRRENLRPVGTFFNTANFQVPPSAGRLSKRLVKNVDYFQSNYVLVFLILVLYCLISSPLLLIVIAGAGGAAYFAAIKNETRKIAIAGHEVTLAQQYAAFYNYDALEVPEDQEQLVGAIVEEV